jgi:RING finger protein 113A
LHDRGDTLTGWQLEQQWEEQRKKDLQKREMDAFASDGKTKEEEKTQVNTDDGLPFACHLCREPFTEPVVTSCGHYFCEKCIMSHVRQSEKGTCPICGKDTHGVFNQPTKLLMKKRRLLSSKATWQEFADASKNTSDKDKKDE